MQSKLPLTGTSIFAVMSQMAAEYNAINLSQGFPDFPISRELMDLVYKYMRLDKNQYAPMAGIPELREAITKKAFDLYHRNYDPATEVTITSGATQALFTAITAFVHPGDEVIVFEPAYDSYVPVIQMCGGVVKFIRLKHPDYHIDWDEVNENISSKTKMIIINTPHNPTGSVMSHDDMSKLEELLDGSDIIVLSDEVYEHLIYDEAGHQSISRFNGLASRGIAVGSFGKTFHATGWKMGYCLAPEKLMTEFRKIHQFVVFSSSTPVQYAIAEHLANPSNYNDLAPFFQKKRDLFLDLTRDSGFIPLQCSGTYFQLLDYSKISNESEFNFAKTLTREHGLAAIPTSSFYHDGAENKVLRFCFAKEDNTLTKATEILCRI